MQALGHADGVIAGARDARSVSPLPDLERIGAHEGAGQVERHGAALIHDHVPGGRALAVDRDRRREGGGVVCEGGPGREGRARGGCGVGMALGGAEGHRGEQAMCEARGARAHGLCEWGRPGSAGIACGVQALDQGRPAACRVCWRVLQRCKMLGRSSARVRGVPNSSSVGALLQGGWRRLLALLSDLLETAACSSRGGTPCLLLETAAGSLITGAQAQQCGCGHACEFSLVNARGQAWTCQ